jgi:hypothetical protein
MEKELYPQISLIYADLGWLGFEVGLEITTSAEIPESRCGFDLQDTDGEGVRWHEYPEIGRGKAERRKLKIEIEGRRRGVGGRGGGHDREKKNIGRKMGGRKMKISGRNPPMESVDYFRSSLSGL